MGKFDKDRYQKELAINYCLARGFLPFVEVLVRSSSELSDVTEVVTDIDVLGVYSWKDAGLHKTLFDCKTSNKMSSINRAFWAAGVKAYAGCDSAFVILKNRAVSNHRFTALRMNVDLHDDSSFIELGRDFDEAFPAMSYYQSSIDRWNAVYSCYEKYLWLEPIFGLIRHSAPLTDSPWSVFRKILAELRAAKGQFDPSKSEHLAVFFDILASVFVLWAQMAREIRRLYQPDTKRADFEKTLRYYLWGGRDAYQLRQQLSKGKHAELPAWEKIVAFSGMVLSAPQSVFGCAHICREISIRCVSEANEAFDQELQTRLNSGGRNRQYMSSLVECIVEAGGLPTDFVKVATDQFMKV